jgi:hypothetical protein
MLAYAVGAVVVLAVAAGLGAMAALTLGSDETSPEGARSDRTGGAGAERTEETDARGDGRPEHTVEEETSGESETAAYLEEVVDIQNGAVEASLRSNDRLVRYDSLTAADVEEMEADSAALVGYDRRAEDLEPPAEYEEQHEYFVLATNELREANELAYRLAADPASATQEDFRAYDRHVDSATSHLYRSNEILGRDYSTPEAAQEVSLG